MNVFIVSTPYHLMLSCSMRKDNDLIILEDKDFIYDEKIKELVKKYFTNNVIIVNNYTKAFTKVIQTKRQFKKIINEINNNDVQKIYGFNDTDPIVQYIYYKSDTEIDKVILEEGIGLYNKIHYKLPLIRKIYGKIFLGSWFSVNDTIGEYKYTNTIYAKNPKILNDKQKQKEVIEYKYTELEKFIKSESMEEETEIWFLGQPLVEDGICEMRDYFECIKKCLDIVKSKNKKMVIKIHPRENTEKYDKYLKDVEIYNNKNIPFELIVDKNTKKKYKLITISSSIMNYSENKNIEVIMLYNLIKTNISFSNLPKRNENIIVINDWMEFDKAMEGEQL